MESRVNYTLVGGFSLFCLFGLLVFIWWIGRYGEDRDSYQAYYLLVKELPSGIKEQTTVRLQGIPVGFVKRVGFSSEYPGKVEIEFWVRKEIALRRDAVAKVETQALSGIGSLAIKQSEESPTLTIEEGEKVFLPLGQAFLDQVTEKADLLAQELTKTLGQLNTLLSGENVAKVGAILDSLEVTTRNLKRGSAEVDGLLQEGTKAFAEFRGVGKEVNKRLQRGEYDVGSMLSPLALEGQKTLFEIQNTLSDFRNTLQEVRRSPYDFLLNQRVSPKGPGE